MIEDDHRLASMVRQYLAKAGFAVVVADDGASGLRHLERRRFDLVLLDLMLPDSDGLSLVAEIRRVREVPIIMVTARGDLADRVVGLELGADDYVAKPFEPRELLARVRAVLRRGSTRDATAPLRFGRLVIDPGARLVSIDGQPRMLTARQFDILRALAAAPGRVLSRERLIERTGADSADALDRTIDVHVARIRAAIEDDASRPRRIITVRGAGYLFAASQD